MNNTVTFNINQTGRKLFKYAPKRASVLSPNAVTCFQTIRLTIIATNHNFVLHSPTYTHLMKLDYTRFQLHKETTFEIITIQFYN